MRAHALAAANPWDLEEVYGELFEFAKHNSFDEEREVYFVHITTGTHIAQISLFLLGELLSGETDSDLTTLAGWTEGSRLLRDHRPRSIQVGQARVALSGRTESCLAMLKALSRERCVTARACCSALIRECCFAMRLEL